MASWQDPNEASLQNLDWSCIDVERLKLAIAERAKQISEHLEGILSSGVSDTQSNRQRMYNALLQVDTLMKQLEELEQKLAEECS